MKLHYAMAIAAGLLVSVPAFDDARAAAAPTGPIATGMTIAPIPGVVAAGSKWTIFWQGPDGVDGLVPTPDGGLLFAQRDVNSIRKVNADGSSTITMTNTNGAGALALDYQGRLIGMLRDKPSVWLLTPEKKLLTDNYNGTPLQGSSDVVVEKRGGLYFDESRRMPTPGVYYLRPNGTMFSFGDGFNANGIALSPDERTLYVTNRDHIIAVDLEADGTGTKRRTFDKLQGENPGGDGMAVDQAGRVYVSTSTGIQVYNPDGHLAGLIPTGRRVTTVSFGGPGKKTLYAAGQISGGDKPISAIFAVPVLTEGVKNRAK